MYKVIIREVYKKAYKYSEFCVLCACAVLACLCLYPADEDLVDGETCRRHISVTIFIID